MDHNTIELSNNNESEYDSPPPLPPRSAGMDALAAQIARRQRREANMYESDSDGVAVVDAIACPPGSFDFVEALLNMDVQMPPQAVPVYDNSMTLMPPLPPPRARERREEALVVAEELLESQVGNEDADVPYGM